MKKKFVKIQLIFDIIKPRRIENLQSEEPFSSDPYFNSQHWKMTLKIRILRCSRRLFIILVSLTVTLFSEKMLIYARCIRGFMSNSIIKSWKDSNIQWTIPQVYKVKCSRLWPWHLRCLIHFVSPVYCEFSYFNSCLVDSGYFHLVNQYFITAVINHMTF